MDPELDPRKRIKGHRERGPKKYTYTVETVSELAGRRVNTLRSVGTRIVMGDLASVVGFVQRSRADASTLLEPNEFLEEYEQRWWEERWPRLEMYRCAHRGCEECLLGQSGYCVEHGGSRRPPWRLKSYFELRTADGFQPYHRVVISAPAGRDVHHIDRNRFNNRIENLQVLTRAEHEALHGLPWGG